MSNAPIGSHCRCGGTYIGINNLRGTQQTKCNRCGTFPTLSPPMQQARRDNAAAEFLVAAAFGATPTDVDVDLERDAARQLHEAMFDDSKHQPSPERAARFVQQPSDCTIEKPATVCRYRLTVWATTGIDPEDGLPNINRAEAMRQIRKLLAKSEMDCDVEMIGEERIVE